ncbi:hypothetical protein CHUAL_011343 [Chamberlinius hualienensis]
MAIAKHQNSNKAIVQNATNNDWQIIYKSNQPLKTQNVINGYKQQENNKKAVQNIDSNDWKIIYKFYQQSTMKPDGTTKSSYSNYTDILSKYLWFQANSNVSEYQQTTTEEESNATTTEDGTDMTTAKNNNKDAKVESKKVVIGDVIYVKWADAICMLFVNLTAAVVLWIGGELTWVGRSTSTMKWPTIPNEFINWHLHENDNDDDEMKMCTARIACDNSELAIAYVTAIQTVNYIIDWPSQTKSHINSLENIIKKAATNQGKCQQEYPCQQ